MSTEDDATPILKVVEHLRKENRGWEKEPDAVKGSPNAEQDAQFLPGDRRNGAGDGGVNDNKADRYATLRLGQRGRTSRTDRHDPQQ